MGKDEKITLSVVRIARDNFELFRLGAFSSLDAGGAAGYMKNTTLQARSSGGEHYLDTVGVRGSNPRVPTRYSKGLRFMTVAPSFFLFRKVFRRVRPTHHELKAAAGEDARPTNFS